MVGYGYGMGMGWACMARRGIHVANPSRPELSPQARNLHVFGRVSVKVDIIAVGDLCLRVRVRVREKRNTDREFRRRFGNVFTLWRWFFASRKNFLPLLFFLCFPVSVSWIRHFLSSSIPLDLDLEIGEIWGLLHTINKLLRRRGSHTLFLSSSKEISGSLSFSTLEVGVVGRPAGSVFSVGRNIVGF